MARAFHLVRLAFDAFLGIFMNGAARKLAAEPGVQTTRVYPRNSLMLATRTTDHRQVDEKERFRSEMSNDAL